VGGAEGKGDCNWGPGDQGFSRAYACHGNPAHFRCESGAGIIFSAQLLRDFFKREARSAVVQKV
jgi:hypothetical protein